MKEGCKRALWFTDSFGLDLLKVVFKTKDNTSISMDFTDSATIQESNTTPSTSNTGNADDNNRQLMQIAYLLDRFGVSDVFYHELSMVNRTLPRSYKIKIREALSNNVELHRLPSPYKGCYRSFLGRVTSIRGL